MTRLYFSSNIHTDSAKPETFVNQSNSVELNHTTSHSIIHSSDSIDQTNPITTEPTVSLQNSSNHGNAITEEEIQYKKLIDKHKQTKSPKKVIQLMNDYHEKNKFTPLMALQTLKTLERMLHNDLTSQVFVVWKSLFLLPNSQYLDNRNQTIAFIHECSKSGDMKSSEDIFNVASKSVQPWLLSHLIIGFMKTKNYAKVLEYLQKMLDVSENLDYMFDSTQARAILQSTLSCCTSLSIVVNIIQTLISIGRVSGLPFLEDYESSQLLASHYLKKVEFLKGVVSMDTLPPISASNTISNESQIQSVYRPEFAFIGRSNVGKSSLINMVCNRKQLAYTSKVPGKTTEFNFFLGFGGHRTKQSNALDSNAQGLGTQEQVKRSSANRKKLLDKPKYDKIMNSAIATGSYKGSAKSIAEAVEIGYQQEFYIVDLPGVGFAQATGEMRSSWIKLLRQYTSERTSLHVVFHLIDSRHGALEADEECFELLATLPSRVQYVIVLTKIDKSRGQSILQKTVDKVHMQIEDKLRAHGSMGRDVPIILTSSLKNEGGAFVWAELLKGLLASKSNSISDPALTQNADDDNSK